jgi:hypothetical protein
MSSTTPHPQHPGVEALLDYWLHDEPGCAAATDLVDEHLMQCDACGQLLDELIALGDGVRAAFRGGDVLAVTGDAFVRRLAERGLRLREYRLPHNGSVNCTVAPDDDLLVVRLEAPLQGVQRLDVVTELPSEPELPPHTLQDVPFDALHGEVVYLPKITEIRRHPQHTAQVRLLAVDAGGGTRELGRYAFRHRPWPGS